MAEPASKPGDSKPTADKSSATPAAPGAVGKALAVLKAFKWPIAGAAGALVISERRLLLVLLPRNAP